MADWGHVYQRQLDNNIADGSSFLDVELDPSLVLLPDDVDVGAFLIDFSIPSPDYSAPPLSIGEIEHLLVKDDYHNNELPNHDSSNDFLSDLLLDSPGPSDQSAGGGRGGGGEVLDASDAYISNAFGEEKIDLVQQHHNNDAGDADDPISKKLKRQLRNRDAAVRSRERKKMYVRDLELKSRYLEGECKRLGMLLQCCFAENQALHLSLQNTKAFDASMTKQESAVLLLESLLLGSLLWFLGIICLHILPRPLQSTLVAVPLENVGSENQGNLAPRRAGSRICSLAVFQSVMMGKRCKASRSRMKRRSFALAVLV